MNKNLWNFTTNGVKIIAINMPLKPYHVFLSGPGGVGKSHIIEMVKSDTIRFQEHLIQMKS